MVRTAKIGLAVVLVALFAAPGAANAAYPGANGKIAFVRANQIWTVNPGSTGEAQLTSSASASTEPEWSPDGTQIAYTRGTGNQREVRIMNADGSGDTPVAGPWAYSPAWSPDGARLAFVAPHFDPIDCACTIYEGVQANLDGSQRRQIANGQPDPSTGDLGPVANVEWSPKGDLVAFDEGSQPDRDISAVNVVTNTQGAIVDDPSREEFDPSWSPTAAKVAYVSAGGVSPELRTVNSNGSGDALVTAMPSLDRDEWSPDGTKLVFSTSNVFVVNPNGTGLTQVTSAGGVDPDWQPVPGPLPPGYPRPKSASPIRVPLVPAFGACAAASANRTHGPPLGFPSCNPPSPESQYLTVGTPDVNGAAANSVGFLKLTTVLDGPGAPDDTDVQVTFSVTDVRCLSGTQFPCANANAQPGPDYSGYLNPVVNLRVTDRYNLPSPAGRDPGTGVDTPLLFSVACASTSDTSTGSTCSTSTTLNALFPGIARKNRRSVWEVADTRVLDGGAGGNSGFGGTTFLRQGLFIP